jgi:membrane carboxypeptidase/penicillin-binding protein PbpC
MKIKLTKTCLKTIEKIKEEMIKRWEDFLNEKELNEDKIKIKITKKKTLIAVPMMLDKPAFRLFVNNREIGFWWFKNGVWVGE